MNVLGQSIMARFFSSILGNIAKGILTFVTTIVLVRILSVESYGRFSYLLYTLIAFRLFFDLGFPSTIFTFLSQARRSKVFRGLIGAWAGLALGAQIIFILLIPLTALNYLWPNEELYLVLMGVIGVYMRFGLWPLAAQVGESNRSTFQVQIINNICLLAHLIIIFILYYFDALTLPNIFISMAIIWGLGSLVSIGLYFGVKDTDNNIAPPGNYEPVAKSAFLRYWLPLVPVTILGASADLLDRWILTVTGGVLEQAFFSIALQLSAIILLVTTSITRIYWKEIAELSHSESFELVRLLSSRVIIYMTFFSLMASVFCILWSKPLLSLALGSEYSGAEGAFAILMIYPVLQTYNSILAVLILSMGLTQRYSFINTVWLILGLFTSYSLFQYGHLININVITSSTLATKLVSLALLQSFLLTIAARKFISMFEIRKIFFALLVLVTLGSFVLFSESLIFSHRLDFVRVLLAGLFYTLLVVVSLYRFPRFFEARSGDIQLVKNKAVTVIKTRFLKVVS